MDASLNYYFKSNKAEFSVLSTSSEMVQNSSWNIFYLVRPKITEKLIGHVAKWV